MGDLYRRGESIDRFTGKTTLAGGFVEWLHDTGGLRTGHLFWFHFDDRLGSVEVFFNRMSEALIGPQLAALTIPEKIERLTAHLREDRFLIVLDDFEVVWGLRGAPGRANTSRADHMLLEQFLARLQGGQTKVLITSRSDERWLGASNRSLVSIGGLQGEDRWMMCTLLLGELGISVNRDDSDLIRLMNLLDGHPLVMRVVMPHLRSRSACDVLASLESNIAYCQVCLDP